jgi:hypothetical protein
MIHMFLLHVLFLREFVFHAFMQLPSFPTTWDALLPWLVMPAVLGGAATYVISKLGSPRPDPKNPGQTLPGWTDNQKMLARLVVYLLIGVLDVGLQLIPPGVIASLAMPITIILGVLAAFAGQAAFQLTNSAIVGFKMVGTALYAIGLRLAFGPTKAHESFKLLVPHA